MRVLKKQELHAALNIWSEYNNHREAKLNWATLECTKRWFGILPKEVWTIPEVLVVTFAKVGTRIVTSNTASWPLKEHSGTCQALSYFKETLISIIGVCGYNKLYTFNEQNLVFANVGGCESCDSSVTCPESGPALLHCSSTIRG